MAAGEPDDTEDKVIRRDSERRERPAATTDSEGRFRFDRPYASRSHFVVRAEGFAPLVSQAFEPGSSLLIQLTRGAPLRVTGAYGFLLPPAYLKAMLERGSAESDLEPSSPLLDAVLSRLADLERRWLARRDLRIGLSWLALAVKNEGRLRDG